MLYLTTIFVICLIPLKSICEEVTCGSALKLINVNYRVRLHSHEVAYVSGSQMQSVTAVEQAEDGNSLWLVKNVTSQICPRGQSIRCGDVLRLEHMETKKNLHSHDFDSPLSPGHQEIAAFGTDGHGDSGDHWKLLCDDDVWTIDTKVALLHVATEKYLAISGSYYNQPIEGHMEVIGSSSESYSARWIAGEGVFFHHGNEQNFKTIRQHSHTEL